MCLGNQTHLSDFWIIILENENKINCIVLRRMVFLDLIRDRMLLLITCMISEEVMFSFANTRERITRRAQQK